MEASRRPPDGLLTASRRPPDGLLTASRRPPDGFLMPVEGLSKACRQPPHDLRIAGHRPASSASCGRAGGGRGDAAERADALRARGGGRAAGRRARAARDLPRPQPPSACAAGEQYRDISRRSLRLPDIACGFMRLPEISGNLSTEPEASVPFRAATLPLTLSDASRPSSILRPPSTFLDLPRRSANAGGAQRGGYRRRAERRPGRAARAPTALATAERARARGAARVVGRPSSLGRGKLGAQHGADSLAG